MHASGENFGTDANRPTVVSAISTAFTCCNSDKACIMEILCFAAYAYTVAWVGLDFDRVRKIHLVHL